MTDIKTYVNILRMRKIYEGIGKMWQNSPRRQKRYNKTNHLILKAKLCGDLYDLEEEEEEAEDGGGEKIEGEWDAKNGRKDNDEDVD